MAVRKEERVLLEQLSQGNTDAFWILWSDHCQHLRGVCHRVLPEDDAAAEDALSETMLKAWSRLPACAAGIDNLRAWLTRVATNVSIDSRRRRSRVVCLGEKLERFGHAAAAPEAVVLHREAQLQLLALVQRLPARLQETLILHACQHLSYAEVAGHLRITEVNARKRLQQARALLAQYASDALPETAPPAAAAALQQASEKLLADTVVEIPCRAVGTRAVCVTLPGGAAIEYHLNLEEPLSRREAHAAVLRRQIARAPRGWKKRRELADFLYARGQWPEAMEAYCRVLSRRRHHLETWLRLGKVLYLSGDTGEAAVVYEAALAYARRPATRLHLRGLGRMCRGQGEQAAALFLEAATREPEQAGHWHALGWAQGEAGRCCEALAAYDRALALNPEDTLALTNSYEPLVVSGRVREAAARLALLRRLEPHSLLALRLQVTQHPPGRDGAAEKALSQIRQALKAAPESADLREALAQAYLRRGEWRAGIALLQEYADGHPHCAPGWYYLAIWLFRTGAYAPAAAAIRTAHALYPHDLHTYWYGSTILAHAGQRHPLRQLTAELLRRFPRRWDACAAAAFTFAGALAEPQRACQLAAQAVALQPELPTAWIYRGEVNLMAGQATAAVTALQRGWELLRDGEGSELAVRAAYRLFAAHDALGDTAAARSWATRALHLAREYTLLEPATGHYWLAQALEATGDRAGARAAYAQALQASLFYPEREVAMEALLEEYAERATERPPGSSPIGNKRQR